MKEIWLAGGCFWGLEEYFSRIDGVTNVDVGYANGRIRKTKYILLPLTDHVETVHITYDESKINLNKILDYYFMAIDPTAINRQGNDRGRQYRTGIYYINDEDLSIIDNRVSEEQKKHNKIIMVEVQELNNYLRAEEYHQDYLKKHPNGYCHIDLSLLTKEQNNK